MIRPQAIGYNVSEGDIQLEMNSTGNFMIEESIANILDRSES